MEPIRTEGDLDRTFAHARLAAVINTWASLGLFEALADGEPRTLAELDGDARSLRVTARILAHAGLLVHRGQRWALSSNARRLYDEGVLGAERSLKVFEDLARLEDVVRDGGPVPNAEGERSGSSIGVHRDDPDYTRGFLKMLYRRSRETARETARWIDDLLETPGHMVDLGGGHGRYGRELVELGHRATLVDFPVCINVARDLHGDKLDYVGGDFFEDDLQGPYDVALASNIVHGLSPAENRSLFERAANALAPGGLLVLKDMFLDEFGLWPPNAALFGMTMLLYTDKGDSYSLTEVYQWLREAGLEPDTPVVFEGFSLVVARKAR